MDFSLTDEQRAIQEAARAFARQEVDPIVDEIDESQRFPREVMLKAGELGFLGILFPEEYGGAGLGYVEYVLVVTELSRVDPSVGISVAAHNSLCSNHIYKYGNDEQRRRWLTPLASGKKIGAWSLTEPGAGSDAAGTRTRAERVEGGWVLNGAKTFTTHGREGDVCVVFAVTDPKGARHHNISAFVLERGMAGFRAGKKENKLGIRASDTSEVIMEDCLVGEDHLLGDVGEGFIQALEILDGGRISIAALGLGTAKGAFDTARAYAKERQQFGQPIAGFQAIRFMLAEMATSIAAAECLTFAAADAMDRGRPVSRLSSQAKLFTGESAVFCAERGVQIHGGYGFIKDYRAEKYFRDSKICTIGEGTSEIQRLVIARQLLSRDARQPREVRRAAVSTVAAAGRESAERAAPSVAAEGGEASGPEAVLEVAEDSEASGPEAALDVAEDSEAGGPEAALEVAETVQVGQAGQAAEPGPSRQPRQPRHSPQSSR